MLQPLANQTENVNAPGVGRVVERFVLDVNAIVEHRRQILGDALQQVVAQDHQRYAAWSHVLLRAGIDDAILSDIDRP